jgi:hypothetical protein
MDLVDTGQAIDSDHVFAGAQNPSLRSEENRKWKMAVVTGRNAQIRTIYDLKPFCSDERRYRVFVHA